MADFVVAVTGGAGGIGLATARAFATAGAHVVIGDVDDEAARAAAEEIGGQSVHLDVRSPESFEGMLAAAGDLDVLVNNAGVAYTGSFLETSPELRDLQIDVNLRGVVNGMAAVLPGMVARGRGHVVNVASLAGKLATPEAAVYSATKFAVVGLTESVRAELHHTGVRVTAVLPTYVPTRMTHGVPLDEVPAATPEDVARAILRLVRRGGPATLSVPRWMGTLPRLAAFTPQPLQDALRGRAAHRDLGAGENDRDAYVQRLRHLLGNI